jgi:hypothetical protein
VENSEQPQQAELRPRPRDEVIGPGITDQMEEVLSLLQEREKRKHELEKHDNAPTSGG